MRRVVVGFLGFLLFPLLVFACDAPPLGAVPSKEHDCIGAEVRCFDGAELTVDFAAPPPDVQALFFRLCRNGDCIDLPDQDPGGAPLPTAAPQPLSARWVELWEPVNGTYVLGTDGRVHLEVFINAPIVDGGEVLQDGDEYEVRVTSETGAILADAKGLAVYGPPVLINPGADPACEAPMACRLATLSLSL